MLPQLALFACLCCIAWLLVKDRRWHPGLSLGAWLPLVWILIIGSRPLSLWFSPSVQVEGAEAYLDGSPIDRTFYQIMIFVGIVVLLRRDLGGARLISNNKWLLLYFVYFAISTLWSEDPFVAFKRWTKDAGNIVMVLVILSEADPAEAVKAILLRCAYVLIPMSIVLVKYFPELARSYNRWTGIPSFTGVTTDKNSLGMVLAALGLALVWALIEVIKARWAMQRRIQMSVYGALLASTAWLLVIANSATGLICFTLGVTSLLFLELKSVRKRVRIWTVMFLAATMIVFQSGIWSEVKVYGATFLNRDATLTGRSEIWESVLAEKSNPIMGDGYYSFWTSERMNRLSAKYHYSLNEAHNGYLETYLNGGILGLAALLLILLSTANRALSELQGGYDDGLARFRLAIVASSAVYGITEAVFSRLNLIWFVLLLVVVSCPRKGHRTRTTSPLPSIRGRVKSTQSYRWRDW